MSNWQVVLLDPAKTILSQIGQFLINVLLVVIILIVGWMISKLVKTVIIKILKLIKLDELAEKIEVASLLAKGGISYSLSELIGVVFYWIAILVTFVIAINAVGLTIAASLLNTIVLYIPNVVAAIFILILGMFIATLLKNVVKTAASNTGVAQANLLGRLTEIIIMIFAIAIALEQLNIGAATIHLLISILLGAIGIAVALAFGLGCKDIAGKAMNEWLDKLKKK